MRRLAVLLASLVLAPAAQAAEAPRAQLVSSDPLPDTAAGQHATEAEPDNFAFGETVVSAFQVGRNVTGGAAAIGWATSVDGGTTWRNGLLPSLTPFTSPAGPWSRVSDPAVAYDRVHGWWLISILALRDRTGGVVGDSAVLTSRSKDGITWEAPVITSPALGSFTHDKNWVVCDNNAGSRFLGRCYTAWTDVGSGSLALATSLDGGATWGAHLLAPSVVARGNGVVPLVRPDGTVVMPYSGFNGGLYSVVSTDGGATFGATSLIATVLPARPTAMRAPPIPSAEIDATGRVFVTWHTAGTSGGPTGIFLSTSADGTTWTSPAGVPTGTALADRFLPGLGVDATSSGPLTRMAMVYYTLAPFPCTVDTCRLTTQLVYSSTAGAAWSDPVTLSPQPMSLSWIADTTDGKMVGDYFSTSFVGGGVAVPIFAAAGPAQGFRFNQAMFSARVPPLDATLRLSARTFNVRREGRIVRASLRVSRNDAVTSLAGARVTCTARVAGRALPVVTHRVSGDTVLCAWRLPTPNARPVIGTVTVRLRAATLSRPFRLA